MLIIRLTIAEQENILTTAFSRFLKMGTLAGKIGFSLVGEKALGLFLSPESREMRQIQLWVKNGDRILETLGSLKGGVMKIGQMLSLQEGLFPPEFLAILKQLQQSAKPVKFEIMLRVLEEDLPNYKTQIAYIDPVPFASASIGQVHKAILLNKKSVAIKIQYPEMNKIILSDLKNLKILFKLLFENMTSANLSAVWEEISDRLSEELDYRIERQNQVHFSNLHSQFSWLTIPKPVDELCSARVLTTEFHGSMRVSTAVESGSQEERNLWGQRLVLLFLHQLLVYSVIHADPNMGNFGFGPQGEIILFDFGSVKHVPSWLRDGYLHIMQAAQTGDIERIPDILKSIQVHYEDGTLVSQEHVRFFTELLSPVFSEKFYYFSVTNDLLKKVIQYNQRHLSDLSKLLFPADVIFIDRTIAGLAGNLNQLGSGADWGALFTEFLKKVEKN